MNIIPSVSQTIGDKVYTGDIFSTLLRDRIIYLGGPINDDVANNIIAQLLFLESQSSEEDIYLYINSPGGSVIAGLAIYDVMNHIKPDVCTICVGLAASMGSILLCSGAKGKRVALPNSEIMIHQPLGGVSGQASDILIHAEHISKTKKKLSTILSDNTGQSLEQIYLDTDRDNYLTAQEALEYGLIDKIL